MKLPPSYPLKDHLVVLPSEEELLLLNSTARFIWEQMADGAALDSTVERFAEVFGVSLSRARSDVNAVYEAGLSLNRLPAQEEEKDDFEFLLPPDGFVTRRYRLGDRVVEVRYGSSTLERQLHPRFSHWEVTSVPGTIFNPLESISYGSLRGPAPKVGTESKHLPAVGSVWNPLLIEFRDSTSQIL